MALCRQANRETAREKAVGSLSTQLPGQELIEKEEEDARKRKEVRALERKAESKVLLIDKLQEEAEAGAYGGSQAIWQKLQTGFADMGECLLRFHSQQYSQALLKPFRHGPLGVQRTPAGPSTCSPTGPTYLEASITVPFISSLEAERKEEDDRSDVDLMDDDDEKNEAEESDPQRLSCSFHADLRRGRFLQVSPFQ